ncbi:MAG: hypothetical protein IT317_13710 [Anaerolineales bacterium]|nr:hypothetical protein [Anaerolineales bacterium]
MSEFDETQASQVALRQSDQQRNAIGQVRYSPWWLGVSTSLSLTLFFVAVAVAYSLALTAGWNEAVVVWGKAIGGLSLAFLVGVVLVPIPSVVVWWCWKAFGVERQRLESEPALFTAPVAAVTADSDDVGQDEGGTELVELRPGYTIDGELVAPLVDRGPAYAELRRLCLLFVRGGLARGGWSRSKLAEGPSKQMKGDEWDTASRELQRLGFFTVGKTGLEPAGDVQTILEKLELAR